MMRDDKVSPISGPFVLAKHFHELLVDCFDFQESNIEIINDANQITQDIVVLLNKMRDLEKRKKKTQWCSFYLDMEPAEWRIATTTPQSSLRALLLSPMKVIDILQ